MNKNPILAIFIAVITPIILLAANEHLETLNQGKSVIINKNIISKVQERKLILEGLMVGINSVKQLQNSTVNNKLFETMLKGLEDTDNSNKDSIDDNTSINCIGSNIPILGQQIVSIDKNNFYSINQNQPSK
jgi:hypothetical protein